MSEVWRVHGPDGVRSKPFSTKQLIAAYQKGIIKDQWKVVKLYSNMTAEFDGPYIVPEGSKWSLNKSLLEIHWIAPKHPGGFQGSIRVSCGSEGGDVNI